ncbi:MAG: hypothetical protein IJY39_10695 [Clostridia bacterium]|nr:hypothetical protein [Clostridia bacterium]
MIVVKTSDSSMFEEAYFVLRRECSGEERDMVTEANRIIEGCTGRRRTRRGGLRLWMLALATFLCGSVLGGFIVGLCSMLFV